MERRAAVSLGVGAWALVLASVAATGAPPSPLKVVGNHVENDRGERVWLRGVNVAGLEWTSDGEGRILETVRTAIDDWRVNHVRLPLAQDRWFGKAREQTDGGAAYRGLVRKVVDACSERGSHVVLDLHWSDAGVWGRQVGQHRMPDRNSVAFWTEVARAYKDHPAVVFDLYNEPHDVSWDVWLEGGQVSERDRRTGEELTYEAVGMRELLDTVRATGATNVVIVGGLDWSYDLSGIIEGRRLADPRGRGVLYANHAYPIKGDTVEQWVSKMVQATRALPVIVSEFGAETRAGPGAARGEAWVRQVLQALQEHQWHWTAWDLHPAAGPSLISDWEYTPTPGFGRWVKQALLGTLPPYPARADLAQAPPVPARSSPEPVGMFEDHLDVGEVRYRGAVAHDAERDAYTLSASGGDMWFDRDAFHFAWKKVSGDLVLAADVALVGLGTDPHRKAFLMVRQSLDSDSAYVDVALHGDGLTSLQFRETKGGLTHEIQAAIAAPKRIALVRRGKYVRMDLSADGGPPTYSGAAVRVDLEGPCYVGIGLCSHDRNVLETVIFTRVVLSTGASGQAVKPTLFSALETQSVGTTDRRVVLVTPSRIEAPTWVDGGRALLVCRDGRLLKVPVAGGGPVPLDTGFATHCTREHGLSPDGTTLAITDQSQTDRRARIHTMSARGGTPRLVSSEAPSYWHGWSPDGQTLSFRGERGGEHDVYTVPAAGGRETRLTTAKGRDDGPVFAPDGRSIYFSSERTGRMQLWRMDPDGSNQAPLTDDEFDNGSPHPSPDGQSLVFLSFEKHAAGGIEDRDVCLRQMSLKDREIEVLGRFLGGQGTMNAPCWSPDGRKIAFVTYQFVP